MWGNADPWCTAGAQLPLLPFCTTCNNLTHPLPDPPPPRAAAGRAEVLSLLQRRRHPELLESELEKKKLQRSVLGVRWHVADMVGSGALLRIPTTVGPLLRVAKRGG